MAIKNQDVETALVHTVKHVYTDTTDIDDVQMQRVIATITEGVTSKTLEVKLKRNALVRKLDVVVTADNATQVAAGVAGQIRTTSKTGGVTSIVVDFGALRTVTAVMLPANILVTKISVWIGTKFADPVGFDPAKRFASLPSEVKTERMEILVTGAVDAEKLATEMFFVIPDLPSGLELRIDDGPPVFTHPAAVAPGTEAGLDDSDWNKESARIVHLAEAFGKLVGDPLKSDEATFKLTLTTRSPGFLDLTEHARDVRYVRRAAFDGAADKDLDFPSEGETRLRLETLPNNLAVEEVRWNGSATIPPERVLPAVGPDAAGVAEITVTPERAIIVRLDPATPLGELTGVRLPLQVGASGAEARVVLWSNKAGANQPVEVVETGASDPANLEKTDAAEWTTFTFGQPVKIPADGAWAALVVSRGEATFAFAATGAATSWATVLWGAPSGPWRNLPPALVTQRGRIRMIGTPRSGVRVDPYRVRVGASAAQPFAPNPKGAAGSLQLAQAITQSGRTELVITSHVPARLKLRDVEVVSTN